MNKLTFLCCSLLLVLAGCGREVPVLDPAAQLRPEPWSQAVVEAARSIPVQHEGRVKPFDTLASFALYSIHGRRDMQFCWGEQKAKVNLTPTEWLLDVYFYPDQAAQYPLFRIDNAEVFQALWPTEKHQQKMTLEYVSYAKLLTVAQKLLQLADGLEAKQDIKNMAPDEQALVHLRDRLWTYHTMHQQFQLLHSPYLLKGDKLQALFDGRDHAGLVEVLQHARQINALAQALADATPDAQGTVLPIRDELQGLATQTMHGAAFFPPLVDKAQQEKWLTLGDLAGLALAGNLPAPQADRLQQLEIAAQAPNQATREEALLAFQRLTVAGAETRNEYGKVDLEARYYSWNLAYTSLHIFLELGFMLVAFSWLFMRQRWIAWSAFGATTVGLGFLIVDIVTRCIITSRPPIKNLYDTFLFIAAVGVSVALITELFTRRRIALSVAPIFGAVLIHLARLFEQADGADTMRQLQAVLDSNYWLATHVTTINIGYSAGMLGMLLANFWLVVRAFRIWDKDPATQKLIVRMVYGVTCFGLLFSVVGTILGGVWANDSWGRFWGWDPKENGALLICLAQTALLHARMSGLVRDFGFCLGAAATGIVVAFSWFHVNLLGVGLHAYGFSSGLKRGLYTFYGVQCGFLLLGITGQLMRMAAPAPAKQHEPLSPPLPAKSH